MALVRMKLPEEQIFMVCQCSSILPRLERWECKFGRLSPNRAVVLVQLIVHIVNYLEHSRVNFISNIRISTFK